jgi:hypothetical protein
MLGGFAITNEICFILPVLRICITNLVFGA